MTDGDQFIASLDVGTTTVRCFIFDKNGNIRGQRKTNGTCSVFRHTFLSAWLRDKAENYEVTLYFPVQGRVEIRHNELWDSCVNVIKEAVNETGLGINAIKGLGISCQRNSFITWKKSTGRPYHNIITWKDLRANDIVNELNESLSLKLLKLVSKLLYNLTWKKRFLAGSILKITNNQVTPRLLWVLRNIPEVSEDLQQNDVSFGTIDTWLLYKLTDGLLHVTDVSNASSTGLYDPFTLCWGDWAFRMFSIPQNIFPTVVDSGGHHFGSTAINIFGQSIPIYCCMADQSASMFGSCCFNVGDVKVTMGTGTFLDINTGSSPHASFYGLYPLVGWKYKNELVYIAEGLSNDTAVLIQFAQALGIIDDPKDCTRIAQLVENNDGVYFTPAFNGLQAPINDPKAAAGFIGLKATTRKPHLLRAILESIVFRIVQLYNILKCERNIFPKHLRVDGGVSGCDFVVQMLADTMNTPLRRPDFTEMSALGAAFLAGFAADIWKDKNELYNINNSCKEFVPCDQNRKLCLNEMSQWNNASNRFLRWYS